MFPDRPSHEPAGPPQGRIPQREARRFIDEHVCAVSVMSAFHRPESVITAMELDAESLQRLRELDPAGQNQLVGRVLRAFASSARRLGQQLAEARIRDDLLVIRHVAHTLKSSSSSIGALALARLCAEIEASIRNEALAGLGDRLDAMDLELNAVLQAVQSLLGPGEAAGSSP